MITNSITNARRFIDRISPDKPVLSLKNDKIEFSSFSTVLFNKQLTNLIHCPITASGAYIVPQSVESIGIEAFAQCKGLTSIAFPLSLKMIGCLAFENCNSLTSVTIPACVEEIGYRAFSNCKELKSIFVQAKDPNKLKLNPEVFYMVDKASCILYVPVGAKKEYQLADQWKDFDNIVETKTVYAIPCVS